MRLALLATLAWATTASPALAADSAAPAGSLVNDVLFGSTWGPIVAGIVFAVLVLAATSYALARPRGAWLKNRLSPYLEAGALAAPPELEDTGGGTLRSRVFGATERVLGHNRAWRKLELTLWRADVRVAPVEFVYITVGAALGLAVVASLLGQSIFIGLIGIAIGVAAPTAVIVVRARKRQEQFDEQLPDLLMTLSSSLKAGHTITHGMKAVVEEKVEPAATEFRRVLTDLRLGTSLETAFDDMSERIDSSEFRFVLTSVTIQREVGGSLAGLLDTVAHTVRTRQQFRRKVVGLTAMARLSANVLIALPILTALALTAIKHDYLSSLLTTTAGNVLLVAAIAMLVVGAVALRKLASLRG